MKTSATKTQANQAKLMPTELIDESATESAFATGLLAVDLNTATGKPVPTDILAGVVFDGGIFTTPVGLYVEGTAGNDTLYGSSKADTLVGGEGNDRLFGREGNDTLIGGNGNDWLDGGAGADAIDGGSGFDTVSFESATSGVSIDLQTAYISDGDRFNSIERWVGSSHMDILMGGNGHDDFEGGAGDDLLFGRRGNDVLSGGAGNDTLHGGHESDVLIGGAGHDILVGDPGFGGGDPAQAFADRFVFTKGSGLDKIFDFQQGLDKIDVGAYGHDLEAFGPDGVLASGWFDENGNLHDVVGLDKDYDRHLRNSDKFFYDTSTGILWECEYFFGNLPWPDDDMSILKLLEPIAQIDPSIRLRAEDLIV
jgi:Ca2+-binding RTX toxin-like protein